MDVAAAGSTSTKLSQQMMSFHDLGHAFHRYGIMSFAEDAGAGAGERKEEDEESKNNAAAAPTPMRKVFENANRGRWPGDGNVSPFSPLSDIPCTNIQCVCMRTAE